MFIQTQKTPNPNSLKFLPGKKVSDDGPYEILKKDETNNYLVRNILYGRNEYRRHSKFKYCLGITKK